MRLDHVFICCDVGAPEADALLDAGLVEGSRNTHPGQGSENRRVFFEVGFIELFWISNPAEAQSPQSLPTRLWPRWRDRRAGACPFAIILSASADANALPPFKAWQYQPNYFPKPVHFAEGTEITEPEIIYLPWKTDWQSVSQPKEHTAPLREIRSVGFGLPNVSKLSSAAQRLSAEGFVSYYESTSYEMTLGFLASSRCRFDLRPTLPLILEGAPE